MRELGTEIEVWPSRLALEQRRIKLERVQRGGLLLEQILFTFNGRYSLLKALCRGNTFTKSHLQLTKLTGPLLVHRLLNELSHQEPSFISIAKSNRLPYQLWHFLVQLRAVGLNQTALAELAICQKQKKLFRLKALASLLGLYEQTLITLGLADESDLLHELDIYLSEGKIPNIAYRWRYLIVRKAFYLSPLDIRLLKILTNILLVHIEFAILEPREDSYGLFILYKNITNYLNNETGNRVKVTWAKITNQSKPLEKLLEIPQITKKFSSLNNSKNFLEFWCNIEYHAEIEALVHRARKLIQSGIPHHKIAIIFPKLDVHGQIATKIAISLGLAVNLQKSTSLGSLPLVQAFLNLLELPLTGFEREALTRVWESPYLGPALAQALSCHLGKEVAQHLAKDVAPRAGSLLRQAGYIDAHEISTQIWLEKAALKSSQNRSELKELGLACAVLTIWLSKLNKTNTLGGYTRIAKKILTMLKINTLIFPLVNFNLNLSTHLNSNELFLRDLKSYQVLTTSLSELAEAAHQVKIKKKTEPANLLAQLRNIIINKNISFANVDNDYGVAILSLNQAQGLSLHTALIGGLTQGQFPRRSSLQHLLSKPESLLLEERIGLPIYYTEEKEFNSQLVLLFLILSQIRKKAILSYSINDLRGRQQNPSFIINNLAELLDYKWFTLKKLNYNNKTSLFYQDLNSQSLWATLIALFSRPRHKKLEEYNLGQAILWLISQRPRQAIRWQNLIHRIKSYNSFPHIENLSTSEAIQLLQRVLLNPYNRKISATWLEEYAKCPQAWFLKNFLHLNPLRYPTWELTHEQEGIWVHKTLALFFTPARFNPSNKNPNEIYKQLKFCLEQALIELEKKDQFGHKLVTKVRRVNLATSLTKVVELELANLSNFRPIAIEERLGAKGKGIPLIVDKGPPLVIIGRLDRRDINSEGMIQITDYKHSKKINFSQALKKTELGITNFQLSLYLASALLQTKLNVPKIEGRLVSTYFPTHKAKKLIYEVENGFLSLDSEIRQRLSQIDKPNLFNQIKKIWQQINTGNLIPQSDQNICVHCSFSKLCQT